MAVVSAFRAIRFDPARVGDLSKVVAPPYDVIPPQEQRALHERHPRNIVWIDFGLDRPGDDPSGDNKYARAARWLQEWLAEGTLVREERPCLYYYEQEFDLPGSGRFVRKGFLGALRLSAFGEGVVFPHEKTLSKPKEDRLALMRATRANTSPVFGLYSDPEDGVLAALRAAAAPSPDLAARDDLGVEHRVWRIGDPEAVAAAERGMRDKEIFIADGHHRYETALAFRDEMRARHGTEPGAAYDHVLMFLCNMDAPGIVILPTHRGIHSVPGFSEESLDAALRALLPTETRRGGAEEAVRALAEAGREGKALAWSAGGGRYHLVRVPDPDAFCREHLLDHPEPLRSLDVVLLHGFLFRRLLGIAPEEVTAGRFVTYYKDPAKAAADLEAGRIQAAFFLNPVTVREFREVARSGHVLPQKTTFFYPKVLTGLVILDAGPERCLPG